MTDSDPVAADPTAARTGPGPGQRLRAAREARDLTQADIASTLHLDAKLIAALEADDFSKLPQPIYVIGYLRAYARIVDLPADPLIQTYEALGFEPPPVVSEIVARLPVIRRGHYPWIPMVLVTAIAIALVGVWQMSDIALEESVLGPSGANNEVGRIGANIEVERATLMAPTGEGSSDQVSSRQPLATVTLYFDDDSWVELSDARGSRLFFATGRNGDVNTFTGVPPFDLLLGYAPGVSVEYNGAPVEKAGVNRKGVASFVVGQANASEESP